ncbi:MarR family transcriptional regulator [Geodermatophilus sp. DSM 44513]|uniref:MarR family winged helix-turn-helix transcriptional regulator n=1 Tax=Geodermatophilus sp. DSM 44513 TaxID=1528104 RepID=UPI00127A09AC|nr:MarR family transcriptional regulator [Geodermatophilus sp. DSM 44513]WNV74272.1 MarR family transcriptional regulator [Geodermatophilus sp. DSM 44513]
MASSLTFDLHVLTARLDRAADRILRAELGLPYRRFLALLLVGEGAPTQRVLAERLGVTEPSTSRMVAVLADEGFLDVAPDPAGGNRRRLALTPAGKERVEACRKVLEGRFADLVARSGVPYAEYATYTRRLVAALESGESEVRR